jgi:uncharacterized DUF497 family protein
MYLWVEPVGFDWDEGNSGKNWEKHGVTDVECEEVFFNRHLVVRFDSSHSTETERRWRALGQTDDGRYLLVAFTLRNRLIRVISARNMTRKERAVYENQDT